MGKSPRRPLTPAHPMPKVEAEAAAALPIVDSIGMVKASRNGWIIVRVYTQGDVVVDREVLFAEPEPKSIALRRTQSLMVACWAKPENEPC